MKSKLIKPKIKYTELFDKNESYEYSIDNKEFNKMNIINFDNI